MTDIYKINGNAFQTSTLKSSFKEKWQDSYTDLLANGQVYWLGGSSYSGDCVWDVGFDGCVVCS